MKTKMIKILVTITLLLSILMLSNVVFALQEEKLPTISYRTHVEDVGWQNYVTNGEMAGTEGIAKRLEAINIKTSEDLGIQYQVHVQDVGWQDWRENDEMAGTEGIAKRLEAIRIKLKESSKYSVVYRVHVQDVGWQDWVQDGEMAGTEGIAKRLEAIEIKIIKKQVEDDEKESTEEIPTEESPKEDSKIEEGQTSQPEESNPTNIDNSIHIKYQTHVEDVGWQDWVQDGEMAGTEGLARRVEAIKMELVNASDNMHIKYRAHVQNVGWQEWKTDGEMAGTEGLALRIEAIQVKIEGTTDYIVEYTSHVENVGWQQWASNEMISGTVNQAKRVEAIKIKIIEPKDTVVPQVKYANYTATNNWTEYKQNGETSGNENSGIKLEALKIALENASNSASIKYQVHVQNIGWMDYVSNNSQAGVTGQNNGIEAIKIELEGLPGYSIEYRAYVNGDGWQDWNRDGYIAGTTGQNKQIGAIQVRLNIDAYPHIYLVSKNIDDAKYPGYRELIEKLENLHPTWNFKLLYTGLNFSEAVYGEYSRHGANLVPSSSAGEWICSVCGTKPYDTGKWYCASDKAIAYYMDPRNFINESSVFQFLDANRFESTSVSIGGIQANINGTFLEQYASDIYTACKNQGVDPYYVISRLIQENGRSGSSTSRGMNGGDGYTYYNPFNIGAYKTANASVYENALSKAKSNGWNTMEKALEGGIVFLKDNWLENYQNTLYQNRFDIDSTNGTALYSHQYMQNLSAAYSEGLILRGYYSNAGKIDSDLTFVIPMYENINSTTASKPSEGTSSEEYPMNVIVNTQSSTLALRSGASTSSSVITRYPKGTVLLSVRRGVNSTWQHVVMKDGNVGYMSGEYLKQIDDEKACNYKAHIKTQSSGGTNVRTGPSTQEQFSRVDYLPDYTSITVIDDSTYKGYEGASWVQWSRIVLSDGRQAFVPSSYVVRD